MLGKIYLVFDGSLTAMYLFIKAMRTNAFVILVASSKSTRFDEQTRISNIATFVYGFIEAKSHVIFCDDPLFVARLFADENDVVWNLDELIIERTNEELEITQHEKAFDTVYNWLDESSFSIFDMLSDCTEEDTDLARQLNYDKDVPLKANCGRCADCVCIWDIYAYYYCIDGCT